MVIYTALIQTFYNNPNNSHVPHAVTWLPGHPNFGLKFHMRWALEYHFIKNSFRLVLKIFFEIA